MIERRAAEIRFEQDESRRGPGRLVGVLLPYGERAQDRPELFEPGALHWPADGVLLREMHVRARPIARFVPVASETEVRAEIELPDTTAGRDAGANVRAGVLSGLSVEFKAEREGNARGRPGDSKGGAGGRGSGGFRSLCGRDSRGAKHESEAAVVALSKDDQKIRDQVRILDVFENLDIRPGLKNRRMLSDDFWKTKIKAGRELVDGYGAVGVPGCVKMEATIRTVAYLIDRWSARVSVEGQAQAPGHLSALRHSGAMALLSRYKRRRGGLI